MKQKKPIPEVISDLRELFKVNIDLASNEADGKFFICKQCFERYVVINMLQEYFQDKVIDGGYLEVGSITFVHTSFEVLAGTP